MGMWRVAVLSGIVVSLLLSGCGADTKPAVEGQGGSGGVAGAGGTGAVGGDGGTAGGGGDGGDGGSAGTGGTGGSEPRCGDGRIDPPEEACDDGNVIDGDGCSSACKWEGDCENPIDWEKISRITEPEFPEFFATDPIDFHGFDVPGGGRCGGGGKKMVMRYVAPSTGRLLLQMATSGLGFRASRTYVRRTCEDPSTELWRSCLGDGGMTQMDVVEGEVLYLFFDAPQAEDATQFVMATEVFPFRAEGESCGPASGLNHDHMWQCAPGFTCRDVSNPEVCSPNSPPSIESARVFRGGDTGNDLFAVFDVTDPNADYWFMEARLYDGAGAPVLSTPNPGAFDADPNQISIIPDRSTPMSPQLHSFGSYAAIFSRFPEIERVDLRMRDLGNLLSNTVSAVVELQAQVGLGQSCDIHRAASVCESDDLVCRGPGGDEAICEARAPERAAACAAATEVGVGTSLEVTWTKEDFDRPADWPLPYSCFKLTNNANNRRVRPETVYRLHLDERRTNVAIRTGDVDDRALTALALYEGCGLQGGPLQCNELDTVARNASRLDFPVIEAGDYLVVVSLSHGHGGGTYKVIVEADPLE